jgi:hypothetical protein
MRDAPDRGPASQTTQLWQSFWVAVPLENVVRKITLPKVILAIKGGAKPSHKLSAATFASLGCEALLSVSPH